MNTQLKQLLFGVHSLVFSTPDKQTASAATSMSETLPSYSYSVWLRHMLLAQAHGLSTSPSIVVELGPGNSLGAGLMALLCGAERYIALDVVKHQPSLPLVQFFDELVELLRNRSPIAGTDRYPDINPRVEDESFPDSVFGARLDALLDDSRIQQLRSALSQDNYGGLIDYRAPWEAPCHDVYGLADMVMSQATLEYVPDVQAVYNEMQQWLKPDGFLSMQVDFRSHGFAADWYGHWCMSDLRWKLVVGSRAYGLNREPLSTHRNCIKASGLSLHGIQTVEAVTPAPRDKLARAFKTRFTDEDLSAQGALLLCTRA